MIKFSDLLIIIYFKNVLFMKLLFLKKIRNIFTTVTSNSCISHSIQRMGWIERSVVLKFVHRQQRIKLSCFVNCLTSFVFVVSIYIKIIKLYVCLCFDIFLAETWLLCHEIEWYDLNFTSALFYCLYVWFRVYV